MANSINFSFDDRLAKPTDELADSYSHTGIQDSHPPQTADGEEFICGNTGNAHPYANAGRDQDRSRMDERIAAQGCSRYVSAGPTPASSGSTGDFSYDTEGAY